MNGIHELVLRGGQQVTTSQLADFRRKIPLLLAKVELSMAKEAPHLHDQTLFLARYTEDVLDGVFPPQDLSAITEAVFALSYFFRDIDIIPDSVPGSGYSDDSAVVRFVLHGHEEEFRRFASLNGKDFDKLTFQP